MRLLPHMCTDSSCLTPLTVQRHDPPGPTTQTLAHHSELRQKDIHFPPQMRCSQISVLTLERRVKTEGRDDITTLNINMGQ